VGLKPFYLGDTSALARAVHREDALAERSQQRGAKIADLLIAAVAQAAMTSKSWS
jgi:hypothetical protein